MRELESSRSLDKKAREKKSRVISAMKVRVKVKKHFVNMKSEERMIRRLTNGIAGFMQNEASGQQREKLLLKLQSPNASSFEYIPRGVSDKRNYEYYLWQYGKNQLEQSRPFRLEDL